MEEEKNHRSLVILKRYKGDNKIRLLPMMVLLLPEQIEMLDEFSPSFSLEDLTGKEVFWNNFERTVIPPVQVESELKQLEIDITWLTDMSTHFLEEFSIWSEASAEAAAAEARQAIEEQATVKKRKQNA